MFAVKLEQGVEKLDQQVLVGLAAKDALENEVGLGVGEDGSHGLERGQVGNGGRSGRA